MTLVTIVMAPNKDNTGPDLDRLEKVEDLHPEIARNMLYFGTAREPSEAELAEYRKRTEKPAPEPETTPEPEPAARPNTFTPRFPTGNTQTQAQAQQ